MTAADALPYITNGGAVGVLSWVFFQIIRGNLVPKSVHDKALEQARQQAEVWEKVASNYKASLDARDGVVPAQLESARLVEAMAKAMQELPAASGEETKA